MFELRKEFRDIFFDGLVYVDKIYFCKKHFYIMKKWLEILGGYKKMKWLPKFPKEGSIKIVTRFAWLPKRIKYGWAEHEYYWIWLETYKKEYYCSIEHHPFWNKRIPMWVKSCEDYQNKPLLRTK